MKKQKRFAALLLMIVILVAGGGYYIYKRTITPGIHKIYTSPWGKNSNKDPFTVPVPDKTTLTLFLQNKEVAKTSDCSVTYPVNYQVPKTTAVADTSLKILFEEELSKYGIYKSLTILNGIAKVTLQSAMTPAGHPIASLSSCEKGHLWSVLHDTLTQYPSVTSVEIFSPNGRVEL